jgi:hypothetical protein
VEIEGRSRAGDAVALSLAGPAGWADDAFVITIDTIDTSTAET